MKRALFLVFLVPLFAALLIGCAKGDKSKQDVYFGFLLGSPRIAGVALDLGPADDKGQRTLRAYVCDGLGAPDGIAIWFKGSLDKSLAGTPLTFPSVGGQEKLVVTAISDRGIYGSFTDAKGATGQFSAYTAVDGAGIYQVTLDQSLHYKGTSTDGAKLDAQADKDGKTAGTITLVGGKKVDFSVRSLALADPADLASHGLPADFRKFASVNQVPGEYTAVIAPGGSHWFGRTGTVQLGKPGLEIIGLDKKEIARR